MQPIPRLEIQRQIIVGHAVEAALAADRPTPLTDASRTRGEVVVSITVSLEMFASCRPIHVDHATDGVVLAFDRIVDSMEAGLRNDVVARGDTQNQALADVQLVRRRVFPQGTSFLRNTMELQWSELVQMRGRMQEVEVAEAIDRLGLRVFADHMLRHVERYGRIVGKQPEGARAGVKQSRADWDEAFRLFQAQVTVDYENDPATQKELVGAFARQLDQQRAAARAAVRARRAKANAQEGAPANAPDGAPAPAAPDATPAAMPAAAPAAMPSAAPPAP